MVSNIVMNESGFGNGCTCSRKTCDGCPNNRSQEVINHGVE